MHASPCPFPPNYYVSLLPSLILRNFNLKVSWVTHGARGCGDLQHPLIPTLHSLAAWIAGKQVAPHRSPKPCLKRVRH